MRNTAALRHTTYVAEEDSRDSKFTAGVPTVTPQICRPGTTIIQENERLSSFSLMVSNGDYERPQDGEPGDDSRSSRSLFTTQWNIRLRNALLAGLEFDSDTGGSAAEKRTRSKSYNCIPKTFTPITSIIYSMIQWG